MKELWYVGFYLVYLYFWIKGLFKYKSFNKAYKNNPLEIEAYTNDDNVNYIYLRERYAWK